MHSGDLRVPPDQCDMVSDGCGGQHECFWNEAHVGDSPRLTRRVVDGEGAARSAAGRQLSATYGVKSAWRNCTTSLRIQNLSRLRIDVDFGTLPIRRRNVDLP